MKPLPTVKVYFAASLMIHVFVAVIVTYAANASLDYWSNFLGGMPFPAVYRALAAVSIWFPWFSGVVVISGLFLIMRGSDRLALHGLFAVTTISVVMLSFTAVGIARPMEIAVQITRQNAANKTMNLIPSSVGNRL